MLIIPRGIIKDTNPHPFTWKSNNNHIIQLCKRIRTSLPLCKHGKKHLIKALERQELYHPIMSKSYKNMISSYLLLLFRSAFAVTGNFFPNPWFK